MTADEHMMAMPDELLRVSAKFLPVQAAVEELCDSLNALYELLKTLVLTAEQKLAAIRSADADALQEWAARETELLEKVTALKCQRQAAIARLAQALQLPAASELSICTLANRLGEPAASILRAKSRGLRELADRLQHVNTVAARAAQDLQAHIRAVFAEVAKANRDSAVYGPEGQHEPGQILSSVEAVG